MSAYDTILTALETAGMTVKAKPTKARAQCPSHQSNGLTLSLRRYDDHTAVHCFAFCETVDVLAAIGLSLRDLFDQPGKPSKPYRTTPPSPLGDIDHFFDRMAREQRLEAHPAFEERRARDLAEARKHRDGDHLGGPVTKW